MKYFQFLTLILAVFFTNCKEKKPSIGEQLEGIWLVQSLLLNAEEIIVGGTASTLIFQNYNGQEGQIEWKTTNTLGGKQVYFGIYSVDTEKDSLHIIWDENAKYGGFDEMAFAFNLNADTLTLETVDIGNNHHYIRTVRKE